MCDDKAIGKPIIIRRGKPEDYSNIIDIISDVYKNFYANPLIYDRNYFIGKILNEEIIMFIAASEDCDNIGVIAISQQRWFRPSPVLGVYAVKSRYRGLGTGFALVKYATNFLRKARYPSTSGYCVTTDSYGRVHFERLGFVCTGYLISIQDNVKLGQSSLMKSPKNTISVHTLPGEKKEAGVIYVPGCLDAVTRHIYDTLPGITYEIKSYESYLMDKTLLDNYFDEHHQTIYIKLDYCGKDLIQKIKNIEGMYRNNPLCTALIYLKLNNSSAVNGCLELLNSGYNFSGYMPLKPDGEYMILYNMMNLPVDLNVLTGTEQMKNVLREVIEIENR